MFAEKHESQIKWSMTDEYYMIKRPTLAEDIFTEETLLHLPIIAYTPQNPLYTSVFVGRKTLKAMFLGYDEK